MREEPKHWSPHHVGDALRAPALGAPCWRVLGVIGLGRLFFNEQLSSTDEWGPGLALLSLPSFTLPSHLPSGPQRSGGVAAHE